MCLTLSDPMDSSPSGSSVRGILQARILEWVAIPFSRGSSWPRNWSQVSCSADRFFAIWATGRVKFFCCCSVAQLMSDFFGNPWTVVCQAPLSMGFPRQEYWSGCHFLLQDCAKVSPVLNRRVWLWNHWVGFSTELRILQSKRLNHMNQHTLTHWWGLGKQRLCFLSYKNTCKKYNTHLF